MMNEEELLSFTGMPFLRENNLSPQIRCLCPKLQNVFVAGEPYRIFSSEAVLLHF